MSKVTPIPAANYPDQEKQPIDPRILNGPIVERNCTDIICLILLFISFWLMWWIAITGYADGQPERLLAAYDSDGMACALDYSDYPYIYFPILHPDYYNKTVCVKECPVDSDSIVECQTNSQVKSCQKNFLGFNLSDTTSLLNFPGNINLSQVFFVYESQLFIDRVCVPTSALEMLNQTEEFGSAMDISQMSAWVNDLSVAWGMILGSFFLAFVMGLIYLTLVRYFSGMIVWIAILGYFIALLILAIYCKTESDNYYAMSLQNSSSDQHDTAQALEYLSYVLFALFGLSIIALGCLYHKIRLAIAVIKTAAIFVRDNFLIILVPVAMCLMIGLLWLWWIITAVYIVSLEEAKSDGSTPFASVQWSDYSRNMFWYWVFAGLWKNAFIQSVCNFIIASTCAIWYFSQGVGQASHLPIVTSIYRVFRYHLGSLAFGSLILAVVQFIRVVLEYVRTQLKATGQSENKLVKMLLDCLRCYMAYFERFIRFLTRNAYIQIAITGKNFCTAAKAAFETVFANSMRFALVGGIGSVFNLIGKLLISVATIMISYLILTHDQYYIDNLMSPILPCVVIFIIAYTVAILFMSIYGMACDTVLMCFIYDEDLNKQSGGGSAQHCPETLREFFELHS